MVGDEDLGKWLGEYPASSDELDKILKPFAPERMSAWKVAEAVGSVRNQSADLADPVPST